MVEKDRFMTVELKKNNVLQESYSTFNESLFREMVEKFSKKITPKFTSGACDGCVNERWEIHCYTY